MLIIERDRDVAGTLQRLGYFTAHQPVATTSFEQGLHEVEKGGVARIITEDWPEDFSNWRMFVDTLKKLGFPLERLAFLLSFWRHEQQEEVEDATDHQALFLHKGDEDLGKHLLRFGGVTPTPKLPEKASQQEALATATVGSNQRAMQ